MRPAPHGFGSTATPELRLNQPQRRAVGIRLRAVGEAVKALRRAGLDADRLDAIDQLLGDAAIAARVQPPPPQRSLVAAMVAEILVGAAELEPASLRRYGTLDAETAKRLERLAASLTELAHTLPASRSPSRG